MDHSASMRRLYDLINAGDIDGFGTQLADDFVEHEETPGLGPTKEASPVLPDVPRGVPRPALRVEDALPSGDKVAWRRAATGTHEGEFMGIPPPARASTCR